MASPPMIHEPVAGPLSQPSTRTATPAQSDEHRTLRRPTSHGRLAKLLIPGRSRSGSTASETITCSAYADEAGPSSGRTTPEQRRRRGKAAAASLLANDAKYKKFAAQVDKALQAFDSVNEWADFISFLSRLLKTLQGPHPPYNQIPRKLIVAKRLAQCLNPALPSGVHQRALDVYAHIFGIIGSEGLQRDLLIWSSGLFPFFQFAATSVRPILINIYDTYYLPLGEDLRPAVKAFILALLPGMEEETGDFFDKVLWLLGRVSEAISPTFFLQNIFLVLISSPSSRLAGLNYLSRKLLKPPEEKLDIGLIVRGVAAALEDENSLVRRGGLDLLLRLLPLNGNILRDVTEDDQHLLTRAVLGVVLQRELSLSRRVYTWLLGTEESPDAQVAHFKQHGLELVSKTLLHDMSRSRTGNGESHRPFKIFLSLLDRWEVGGALSENLAIPALQAIKASLDQEHGVREEVLMTASAVYDAMEPIIVWRAFYEDLKVAQDANLMQWVIDSTPQKDEEVTGLHVPVLLEMLLHRLINEEPVPPNSRQLARSLLRRVPVGLLAQASPATSASPSASESLAHALYASKEPKIDDFASRVAGEVIPAIVVMICDLSASTYKSPTELLTTLEMTGVIIDADAPSLSSFDSTTWTSDLLVSLTKTSSSAVTDAIVTMLLKASRSTCFQPPVNIANGSIMTAILDNLFRYLRPEHSIFHARAVELLWEYNQLAEIHSLENVIAQRLSISIHPSKKQTLEAMDAFGVLWRLTDDSMLPGEIFYVPICAMLDLLKSSNPAVQRGAQTWMRCNLGSYFRAIDPILARLLDPASGTGDVTGAADPSSTRYLVERLHIMFDNGRQSLSRLCQNTEVAKSAHSSVVSRSSSLFPDAKSYLDLIIAVLLQSLGDLRGQAHGSSALRLRLHDRILHLLELLVPFDHFSRKTAESLRSSLLLKLESEIRSQQVTLQPKLLHLIQDLGIVTSTTAKTHHKSSSLNEKLKISEDDIHDRRLVQLVIEGVSSPANRPILQHWVDFLLHLAPSLQPRPALLHTLSECFSMQLRAMIAIIHSAHAQGKSANGLSEVEPVILLSALERVVGLSGPPFSKNEDGRVGQEGGSGILGLMSGVFIADSSNDEKPVVQSAEYLTHAVEALLATWTATAGASSRQMIKIREKAQKALEKMFKSQPVVVVGGCIAAWAGQQPDIEESEIFDCIDTLTPSAQKVVEIVTDNISARPSRVSTELHVDAATMAFLEAYISRLEAPIAVQIWNTSFGFARDLLATATTPSTKAQLYPLLRCVTVLCRSVASTSALEDKRLRRELQDVYPRVLDAVVANSSKSGDLPSYRRISSDKAEKETEQDKPELASRLDIPGQYTLLKNLQLYGYLASAVLPNLRSFMLDPDRIAAPCTAISTHIITPALRARRADLPILRLILEMTKIPPAVRAWRQQVGDAFNDGNFFRISTDEVVQWKPIICALMDTDKERFAELLSRITPGPSANIFTNREQEMISRSSNLRRLSFVLLAADENHYLTRLPAIQEKLVDILRTNVVSPRVHSEVYLCLRVMMCRISPQHLTNFWPVILAELLRVFEHIMDEVPSDGSESLALALAACKFLDLLLVIQSEDFQIHQWMFVTDTTDAVYPPEDFTPEAIMDTISENLSEHSHGPTTDVPLELDMGETSGARKPRLSKVKTISSLRQLQSFFSRASIDTFEGVYSNAGVDWPAVEEGLIGEIFEAE